MSRKTIKYKSISLLFIIIGICMLVVMLFNRIKNEYYIFTTFSILVISVGMYVKLGKREMYE